jgi:hypothetical protein
VLFSADGDRLQHTLMDLQQQQLDQLAAWLNQMDAQIKSYPPIGGNEADISRQIEDLKVTDIAVKDEQSNYPTARFLLIGKLTFERHWRNCLAE